MVVGPCPTGNMTGSEVTEAYGLFGKTDNLDGRVAKSKTSGFANQKKQCVCAALWMVVVNFLLGNYRARHGKLGQS